MSEPNIFTREVLDWQPWLEPVVEAELTPRQLDALIDAARAKSAYFTLLAHDPDILKARTLADKDIFYNTKDGLERAERELAATATSRFNGCIFCASVHARFAAQYSKRDGEIDRLLALGIGENLDQRWNAIVAASVALTRTPSDFGSSHIKELRQAGLDDDQISDVIHAASFFNWANRLMLSLGQPFLTSA